MDQMNKEILIEVLKVVKKEYETVPTELKVVDRWKADKQMKLLAGHEERIYHCNTADKKTFQATVLLNGPQFVWASVKKSAMVSSIYEES